MDKKKWNTYVFILLFFLASRLFLLFIGYIGMNLFAHYTQVPQYYPVTPGSHTKVLSFPSLQHVGMFTQDVLSRFDARFYLRIAEHGYPHISIFTKHAPASWVFFPLYPMTIAFTHFILPFLSYTVAGIVCSNVCFVVSLIYLYEIAKSKGLKERTIWRVLGFVLIFPSSLFFSIPYTESLFFMLSTMTVYYSIRKQYFLASLVAGLSTVTRFPGFINIGFVVAMLIFEDFFVTKRFNGKYILYAIVSILPISIFLAYMRAITGDFLAPIHEEANWFRKTSIPFESYFRYFTHPYFISPGGWDNGVLSFTMMTLVLGAFVWALFQKKRMLLHKADWVLYIYGLFLLVVPFSTSSTHLTSMVRYSMVAFPFYIYLAVAARKHEILYNVIVMVLLGIQTIVTIGYCNDYYFVV